MTRGLGSGASTIEEARLGRVVGRGLDGGKVPVMLAYDMAGDARDLGEHRVETRGRVGDRLQVGVAHGSQWPAMSRAGVMKVEVIVTSTGSTVSRAGSPRERRGTRAVTTARAWLTSS